MHLFIQRNEKEDWSVPLQSTTPSANTAAPSRKPLHIVDTNFLEGNDVLVRFSDGTSAIYEAEELEKLRPSAKRPIPAMPSATPPFCAA
jgi:hypothetical protein